MKMKQDGWHVVIDDDTGMPLGAYLTASKAKAKAKEAGQSTTILDEDLYKDLYGKKNTSGGVKIIPN